MGSSLWPCVSIHVPARMYACTYIRIHVEVQLKHACVYIYIHIHICRAPRMAYGL